MSSHGGRYINPLARGGSSHGEIQPVNNDINMQGDHVADNDDEMNAEAAGQPLPADDPINGDGAPAEQQDDDLLDYDDEGPPDEGPEEPNRPGPPPRPAQPRPVADPQPEPAPAQGQPGPDDPPAEDAQPEGAQPEGGESDHSDDEEAALNNAQLAWAANGEATSVKVTVARGSYLVTEPVQIYDYLQTSPWKPDSQESAGNFPYKHVLLHYNTKAEALAFTDAKKGNLHISGTDFPVGYRGLFSCRTDVEVRKLPTSGANADGEPIVIGYGQMSHRPALTTVRALIDSPTLRSMKVVYTMSQPGINRNRGCASTVRISWHSRVAGADDKETARNLPYLLLIPGTETEDKRGTHAHFLVFNHWEVKCDLCNKTGHARDSIMCPQNPQGLQRRSRDARQLGVAAARARTAAAAQQAQARRPAAVNDRRNVLPRNQY
jgi:hypothetical protein